MIRVIWVVLVILAILVPSYARAAEPGALAPLILPGTRLMIFSPHPDDETLGAAGLIQRVLREGGKVKVVFMTNGAGFPEGVEQKDRISNPTAKDYRDYGDERRGEALMADTKLGLREGEITFLGFPDGGLTSLFSKYCSGSQAYRSPYTKQNCPPPLEIVIPHTIYTGDDLTREIERKILDFRPDVVATTPPQDEHPDHHATYSFVMEALARLSKKHPGLKPRVLTFLVHFGQWPIAQGAGTGSHLNPPEGFPDKGIHWVSLALTPEEAATKRQAILEYHTQMLVMGRYLLSFARSNELFILENRVLPQK
ncbi:MAG: PIG-L family deacetylase [Desulfobaccales bacterium]